MEEGVYRWSSIPDPSSFVTTGDLACQMVIGTTLICTAAADDETRTLASSCNGEGNEHVYIGSESAVADSFCNDINILYS